MSSVPTYTLRPVNDILNDVKAVSFLRSVWLWLRIWLAGMTGQGIEPTEPASYLPIRNRAQRHLSNHFNKGPISPVRNLAPFYRFGLRDVSPTQFLERLCRLSCDGRIDVYHMIYWSHRLVREALMAMFERGARRASTGLWQAHLWPS